MRWEAQPGQARNIHHLKEWVVGDSWFHESPDLDLEVLFQLRSFSVRKLGKQNCEHVRLVERKIRSQRRGLPLRLVV